MIIPSSFFKNDIYIKLTKNPSILKVSPTAFIVFFFPLKRLNLNILKDEVKMSLDNKVSLSCEKCRALFHLSDGTVRFVHLLIFAESLHIGISISTQSKPVKPARLESLFLGIHLLRNF